MLITENKRKTEARKPVKKLLKSFGAVLLSTAISLGVAEMGTRSYVAHSVEKKLQDDKSRSGFSHNPFMIGYDCDLFEYDKDLGFRFPEGKMIGKDGFVSMEQVIENIKSSGKKVILNLGDSSTSGWNSNNVSKNNKNSKPFFTYRTYSDILAEKSDFYVINAGVPGYTSLQGKLYLKKLLAVLENAGIKVDYVTIYFGNNDSTWNVLEDRYKINDGEPKSYAYGVFKDLLHQVKRVSEENFKTNIEEMIMTTKTYGARPIVIVPSVRYHWKPGLRSELHEEEFWFAWAKVSPAIKDDLRKAIPLYEQERYLEAYELDNVIPRIKPGYLAALKRATEKQAVALVDTQGSIDEKKVSRYFVDYCHPTEKLNEIIVEKILLELK
ncbi:MAG: GDSL-type esterase/lipase family protein [Candidatus Micrarchaeota archaeon]